MRLRHKRPTIALVAVAAVATLGLVAVLPSWSVLEVARPRDGVTVKDLTADLAFGAEESSPEATPLARVVRSLTAPLTFDVEEPWFDGPERPTRFVPAPDPLGPCPAAAGDVFPEEVAGKNVDGSPEPGVYRWKQSGSLAYAGGPSVPLPSMSFRTVRKVERAAGFISYEVEAATPVGVQVETIELRTGGAPGTDGVYLLRLRSEGIDAFDFHPPSALAPKLLSLPVVSEHVSAASVDPVSGIAFTLSGDVDASSRKRLDACGETVDAWAFTGSRTVQSTRNPTASIQSTRFDSYFAPQLGGLFVGEHHVSQSTFGPVPYALELAANIGGLKPRAA